MLKFNKIQIQIRVIIKSTSKEIFFKINNIN